MSDIATEAQNAALEHTEGGTTTRDDALDAGVPMKQGQASEPVGPEDALGEGAKRGDYRDRIVGEPHESVPNADAGKPVTRWVNANTGAAASEGDKGAIEVRVDNEPNARLERQAPRAEDIGDAPGKGGVTTAPGDASPEPEDRDLAATPVDQLEGDDLDAELDRLEILEGNKSKTAGEKRELIADARG